MQRVEEQGIEDLRWQAARVTFAGGHCQLAIWQRVWDLRAGL